MTVHKHNGELHALPDKLHPSVFPGLNIDNLPLSIPIATISSGKTMIRDGVFEGRVSMYMEFQNLGVHIEGRDEHRLYITGPLPAGLIRAVITCPTAIRPAIALLIGMLAVPGVSMLKSAAVISQGYEDYEQRFNMVQV